MKSIPGLVRSSVRRLLQRHLQHRPISFKDEGDAGFLPYKSTWGEFFCKRVCTYAASSRLSRVGANYARLSTLARRELYVGASRRLDFFQKLASGVVFVYVTFLLKFRFNFSRRVPISTFYSKIPNFQNPFIFS
jgi:hypothetical protein